MRRLIPSLVILALWVTLGSINAGAQIRRFTVTLPFAFQAAETAFPPGSYVIEQEANRNLTIRAEKGKESGSFTVNSLPHKSVFDPPKTWLVFHRSGDKYFLAEIWRRHLGVQLPVSSAEKKLRDSGENVVDVTVNVK